MLFSKYFKLGRTQSGLDFLDIHVNKDIPVFVDPSALRSLETQWGHACVSLLESYFQSVLSAIRVGDDWRARSLLAGLNERNEFHLGFSREESRGHALGPISAKKIWNSLTKSKAAKTGLLRDLEDTVLFVEGVGPDLLSDAICNIIRGPLIEYTQNACTFYGIPLTKDVESGPLWNPLTETFESALVELPVTKHGKVVLLPKVLVRVRASYEVGEYYRHYLMPLLQEEHKSMNSELVRTIKTGKRKGFRYVTKKDLYAKYGAGKLDAAKLTATHPSAYVKYRDDKRKAKSPPLGHSALAQLENIPTPDFGKLVKDVQGIPTGNASATNFENAIEQFLSALFYPALSFPRKQHEIHNGRKRIDLTYSNVAQDGFFSWLAQHYPASHVFIECKNYGKEVGNPELDQISSRFAPSRGTFGILVVRSLEDRELMLQRCHDTAKDARGYVVVIEDKDLPQLVLERSKVLYGFGPNVISKQFQKLID